MIASHNTFTYLPPRHWWQRLWDFAARCQSKTIEEQYKAGVRFFDLRLVCEEHATWMAHTATDYDPPCALSQLLARYPDCGWRIVREKGGVMPFKRLADVLLEKFPANIREVVIDRDAWEVYRHGDYPRRRDVTNYPQRTRHWWQLGIRWPRVENRHYPRPTQEMEQDTGTLYWCDFV